MQRRRIINIMEYRYTQGNGFIPRHSRRGTRSRCLPVITEEDICDRSKSDGFTKVFAFIQFAWLVTQCSTRAAVGLPLTELELMTLAFIVAALVMYGFWWYKPFDVQRATMLLCPEEKAIEIRSRLRQNLKRRKQQRQENLLTGSVVEYVMGVFAYFLGDKNFVLLLKNLMFTATGIVISGLHIFAWSWSFPSYTIRILWRVFSVAATCSLPALFIILFLAFAIFFLWFGEKDDCFTTFLVIIMVASMAVYVISRLGMIVLVFYCFSSMPAAVYETVNWNTIFPHFS
jgi:hypothetical protein